MKAPKVTFTKKFSACDLLVALGVKESDTKTKIFIDKVYCDGDDNADFDDYDIYDDAYTNADGEAFWKHGNSNCPQAKGAKHGAQGTLTQVFYNGKDADGNKHYTITSIETWLGKVTKVTNKTTARDNHVKSDGAVKLNAYFNNLQKLEENNYDYCGKMDEAGHTGHCAALVDTFEQNDDGTTQLTFNDPTGLKKDDYVLFTYSFKQDDNEDMGVSPATSSAPPLAPILPRPALTANTSRIPSTSTWAMICPRPTSTAPTPSSMTLTAT